MNPNRNFLKALVSCALFLCSSPMGVARADTPPVLDFPADCTIGADCWILSFVDTDLGKSYRDHQCGLRTNEANRGTGIALTQGRAPHPLIPVLAAAKGVVIGVRDGVPENVVGGKIANQQGRECGNGVRIDHGNGWFTQYCHLRPGSITVKSKQEINTGDKLGLIGNSGRSETPHLHFQLSKETEIIDPFTGHRPSDTPRCGTGAPLWSQAALEKFGAYEPSHLRNAGFSVTVPNLRSAQGIGQPAELPRNRKVLILYSVFYGMHEGSEVRFTITNPDGSNLLSTKQTVAKNISRQFLYAGKKTPEGGWPPGVYTGEITLALPNGGKTYRQEAKVTLR